MIRRHLSPKLRRWSLTLFSAASVGLLVTLWANPVQAAINVTVTSVEPQAQYSSMRVYAGKTVASRVATLGFNRGGEVFEVLVDIGDVVTQGDVLARLNTASLSSQLRQAKADVALAQANLQAQRADTRLALNTETRLRTLKEKGHVSQQNYDEALLNLQGKQAQLSVALANLERARAAQQTAEVHLSEAAITAPFNGTIQTRLADEGTQIRAGESLLRVVEQGGTEAHVGIPSNLVGKLQAGQRYAIRWQEEEHHAQLKSVLPEVDPATRTHTAVFVVPDSQIPLGAVVELALGYDVAANGFWLPLSALSEADRGLWSVFVVSNKTNTVERRLVEIVHSESQRVFVRGTLSRQDKVITTGVHRVVPGQTVTPVEETRLSYAG